MKLSKRISAVGDSATIAITAMARRMQADGIDLVSFGAGEPDFDTPDFIRDAAKAALDAGDTKYTPQSGRRLQQAIAEKLARENGLQCEPDQIIVTFGGKHALYDAFQAALDPGEKVLLPGPYWNSYPEQIRLAGGEPVVLPTTLDDGWKITPEQILGAADGAKIILINSPSNPTGATYTPRQLAALAQAILKTDLTVFSDEVYEKLVYDGTEFVSFASLDERLPPRTVTFNSLSKTASMPGWRIGWAAGPRELIAAMGRLRSHETTNPVSFVQAAALAAYTDGRTPETIESMRREFERRAAHMHERLSAMPGVRCAKPTGALYCFPDVSAHYGRSFGGVKASDSSRFAEAALKQAQVALVPGAAFGADNCVRLCFAMSMADIDKGLDRLEKMLR
ncbi:MAG TPA: pyridoxal phosphate-dependent aminotransferase [Phycisphaerae bacterium]|nr:pyridoxal phosphate-dependent aminotransferase [Phycisphaerae bacterium]